MRQSLWCNFCRNWMITSSKMAAERSEGRSFNRDFKILLHTNRLAHDVQTSQLWFMGEAFSNLLEWMSSLIQDGRRLKIAQILKTSSSHEPPVGFRRILVGMIDQRCSSRIAKTVTQGSKMGVARGVKSGSNFIFDRIWSYDISNRRYRRDDHSGEFYVKIG